MIVENVTEIDHGLREAAGEILMNAAVGTCRCFFEIRRSVTGAVTYWVYASQVTREVYRDCLITAHFDTFNPETDLTAKEVMSD